MPASDAITVPQLSRLVGTPDAPALIDVRLPEDRAADPRLLPASLARDHADVAARGPALAGRHVVVACRRGRKLSQGTKDYSAARPRRNRAALWTQGGVRGGAFPRPGSRGQSPLAALSPVAAAACVTENGAAPLTGTPRLRIATGAWHILRLRLERERFMAWFDDAPVFEAHGGRIRGPGRVAFRSTAGSYTLSKAPRIEVLR